MSAVTSERVLRVAAGAAAVGAAAWAVVDPGTTVGSDLLIYRRALENWERGDLYSYQDAQGLGFTYPPPAAVLLEPVTWPGSPLLGGAWMAMTLALMGAIAWLFVTQVVADLPRRHRMAALTGVFAVLALSSQGRSNLVLGQVSLFIAAATLADSVAWRTSWWRGVLTGVATAMKFLPAIFIPYWLLTKQWRTAVMATATFALLTLAGWLVLPQESRTFWTMVVQDSSRIGPLNTTDNQSLRGLFARAALSDSLQVTLWLVLGSGLVLIAYVWAIRATRGDDHFAAAVLVGSASALITPISWPHHQIWLVLAGLVLLTREHRLRRLFGALILALCLLIPVTLKMAAVLPPAPQALMVSLPTFALLAVVLGGLGSPLHGQCGHPRSA